MPYPYTNEPIADDVHSVFAGQYVFTGDQINTNELSDMGYCITWNGSHTFHLVDLEGLRQVDIRSNDYAVTLDLHGAKQFAAAWARDILADMFDN